MGFFDKLFGKKEKESLDQGLEKTRENFFTKITKAVAGKSTVDDEVLDNLEEALVSAGCWHQWIRRTESNFVDFMHALDLNPLFLNKLVINASKLFRLIERI